ncbi:MAG: hypothetical protein FWC40_01415 [Proteobacteria bacterium]|nr:hypothetical protein [Pseudomonadota bacterium]
MRKVAIVVAAVSFMGVFSVGCKSKPLCEELQEVAKLTDCDKAVKRYLAVRSEAQTAKMRAINAIAGDAPETDPARVLGDCVLAAEVAIQKGACGENENMKKALAGE